MCVENQTIVANIVSSKSYPRNILMTFKFTLLFSKLSFSRTFLSIYSQSGRNSKKYDQFDVHQPLGLFYSENDVSGISTEKSSKRRKTSFFGIFNQTPKAKIEKNSSHSLKFRQFSGFSPNIKTFRYKL